MTRRTFKCFNNLCLNKYEQNCEHSSDISYVYDVTVEFNFQILYTTDLIEK